MHSLYSVNGVTFGIFYNVGGIVTCDVYSQ